MIEISDIFAWQPQENPPKYSLDMQLEAIIGKYFLSGAGVPEVNWYGIYHVETIQRYEGIKLVQQNLKGYVYKDNRMAFVLRDFIEEFQQDTKAYGVHCIGVDTLDQDELSCSSFMNHSEEILPALWIEDDFMNYENIPFDEEIFLTIDTGVPYLNPKHFSVNEFVKYARFKETIQNDV